MEFPTLWVLTPDGQKPVEWGVELRLGTKKTVARGAWREKQHSEF
jgi:hypothetical protein